MSGTSVRIPGIINLIGSSGKHSLSRVVVGVVIWVVGRIGCWFDKIFIKAVPVVKCIVTNTATELALKLWTTTLSGKGGSGPATAPSAMSS